VLASQFAAIAALAAALLFRERLGRAGVAGVIVIAAGVAAVSALRV
jgi:drug/metabolite transporter (DMT)-like permease